MQVILHLPIQCGVLFRSAVAMAHVPDLSVITVNSSRHARKRTYPRVLKYKPKASHQKLWLPEGTHPMTRCPVTSTHQLQTAIWSYLQCPLPSLVWVVDSRGMQPTQSNYGIFLPMVVVHGRPSTQQDFIQRHGIIQIKATLE